MKKLLLLCLVLLGGVMRMSADNKTIYVKPGVWNKGETNETFGIWAYGSDSKGSSLIVLSAVTGVTYGLYKAEIDESYTKFKFERYNGSAGYDDSGFPKEKWNETDEISISTDIGNYYYEITGWNSGDLKKWGRFWFKYSSNSNAEGGTIISMNTTNGYEMSATLDNESGSNLYGKIDSDGYGCIYPESYGDYYLNFVTTSNASLLTTYDNEWYTNSVAGKFVITFNYDTFKWSCAPYRTTTIGTAGYTTWSNGEKYEIDATHVEDVYVVSADGTSKVTLTSKKGSTFPAGEGVIIKGSGEVKINAVASDATATTIGTNYLVGSGNSELSDIATTAGKTYVFSWDGSDPSTVGFYKASGSGKLAAHKAYLQLPTTSSARDFVGFDFGETTGIANLNDNVNFNADAPMYNLAGQRVSKSYKGVVIVNGKKMLMK